MTEELLPPDERATLLRANEEAARYFRAALLSAAGAGPRRYLSDRGLDAVLEETVWTVGHAPPGWTRLRDHLRQRGFADHVLIDAGLASRARNGRLIDRFRDRLTFGIRTADGELVGFTARSAPNVRRDVPKYLNTPRTTLYDKGAVLLGLGEQAERLHAGATPVLVEGALDVIAVELCNASEGQQLAPLGLCGTALTGRQAEIIEGLSDSDSIIVAFDRDSAGSRAALSAYSSFRGHFPSISAAGLAVGADPADLWRRGKDDGLRAALRGGAPLADRLVDDLITAFPDRGSNAEVRVACLRAASRLIVRMLPADIARQSSRLSSLLDVSQETTTRELVAAASPRPQPPPLWLLGSSRLPRERPSEPRPSRR